MRVDVSVRHASHYCTSCGCGMKAREERFCHARDGDLCEPKKTTPLAELGIHHPRVLKARLLFQERGCRHRPRCKNFIQHKRAST